MRNTIGKIETSYAGGDFIIVGGPADPNLKPDPNPNPNIMPHVPLNHHHLTFAVRLTNNQSIRVI